MDHSLAKVVSSIHQSEKSGLLVDNQNLSGYSGKKLVGTLQRLSSNLIGPDECYLEIGVFQGLTLLSVALALDKGTVYGIDNFAFFDPKGENYSIVKDRILKLSLSNVHIINEDYEDAMETLSERIDKKVKIFFIDGPHDYRSQLMCLLLSVPYLAKGAVIIVDDCNYRHVRQANRDFLVTHPKFKMLFEAYTSAHPANMNEAERALAKDGWWNGVNVIIRDENDEIATMYPPTERNRMIYESEHLLHAMKYPLRQIEYHQLLNAYDNADFKAVLKYNRKLYKERNSVREGEVVGRYSSLNTYSEGLPSVAFNPSID